jgi:hypothetical protein
MCPVCNRAREVGAARATASPTLAPARGRGGPRRDRIPTTSVNTTRGYGEWVRFPSPSLEALPTGAFHSGGRGRGAYE